MLIKLACHKFSMYIIICSLTSIKNTEEQLKSQYKLKRNTNKYFISFLKTRRDETTFGLIMFNKQQEGVLNIETKLDIGILIAQYSVEYFHQILKKQAMTLQKYDLNSSDWN